VSLSLSLRERAGERAFSAVARAVVLLSRSAVSNPLSPTLSRREREKEADCE
jgi:hypothetical protein